ncbi:hypothetical protein niasHS_015235 [Heterodera schachtii]|uniref:beta-fructofuranosidase n=2 Tax=Heterodera TaxID=34509 RepID=A0ABD2I987_HETSC
MTSDDRMLTLTLTNESIVHFWIHPVTPGDIAKVFLCPSSNDGLQQQQQQVAECAKYSSDRWYEFFEINGAAAGDYLLRWTEHTKLSLVYVYEPKTVLEEGIRIIFVNENAKLPSLGGSYHFRAPFGWTSDPSGFVRSKDGLFHLFYQHYPHAKQYYLIHWGHAVSKDLVNWIHLPIFMIPPNVLHLDFEVGYFVGSVVNLPSDDFGIFWTQRIPLVLRGTESENPWRENQNFVSTKDLIHPDWHTHKIVLDQCPSAEFPSLGNGFRDPVVSLGPGGYYYMSVGGERKDGSAGVVLLYRNESKERDRLDKDWAYQGILWEDSRDRMCELPMLIALGDPLDPNTKWLLSYMLDKGSYTMCARDAEGRERLNPLLVGHFDGKNFQKLFEQEMDFARASFAYQGFYDKQSARNFLIGWIFDYDMRTITNDALISVGRAGILSLTVPKELVLSENEQFLLIKPLPELNSLRMAKEPQNLNKGQKIQLEMGQAELFFQFKWANDGTEEKFELDLTPTHLKGEKLEFRVDHKGIELKKTWEKTDKKRMLVHNVKPTTIHVFIDLDSVEYFADDGRWSGTVRLTNETSEEKRIGTVELKNAPLLLEESNLWYLKYELHKSARF